MWYYTQDRLFKHRHLSIPSVCVVVYVIFVATSHITSVSGACVSKKSQQGYTLEGSAYDSTPAENYPTCLTRCLTDTTRCKSVSYDLAAKTCELSIYSRWTKRLSYKPKTNSIYMEMVGVEEVFRNVTEPQSTAASSSSSGSFSPEAFCVGKADGDYSHPTDCNQYVTCSAAIKIARACGTGMNFHPDNKVCDFESKVVCP